MSGQGWQPIATDTPEIEHCLLWCSDIGTRGAVEGVCIGQIYHSHTGAVRARSSGKMGDWTYTHWMALPEAPVA